MRNELIPLVHFLLTDASTATSAPGHRVVRLVNQLAFVALLQERPDRVVVLLRHREIRLALPRRLGPVGVGAVPVHPHAEADRLIALSARKGINAILALGHELIDALELVARNEILDVALRFEL